MPDPYCWIEKSLKRIHQANWYRRVQAIAGAAGPVEKMAGREMVNFASNDYLGLAALAVAI